MVTPFIEVTSAVGMRWQPFAWKTETRKASFTLSRTPGEETVCAQTMFAAAIAGKMTEIPATCEQP